MHARIDNPELLKHKTKIPIYSYPEYIYEQSKNKKELLLEEVWKLQLLQ